MRRNKFLSVFSSFLVMMLVGCNAPVGNQTAINLNEKEIYEWRIYTVKEAGSQMLDDFFQNTFIPAYNRQGISVGAFSLYNKEDIDYRYLLFVYPNMDKYLQIRKDIWKDQVFRAAAQPFYDQTAPEPAYEIYETYLCEAFDAMPKMRKPDKGRTLFEYRNYKSPNDESGQRKVKMFNSGEIDVFDKVGVNSVCYGEVLAGSRMPSLIYLTWYKDEPTRNEAWDKFREHPEWITMRALPEYANTTNDNKMKLLSPMSYSQY